jgi:hypothetical protein
MADVDLPVAHVREQLAGAVDLIVHMARLGDGRRMVARVSAVEGLRRGHVVIEDVFAWRRTPAPGFVAGSRLPAMLTMLKGRDERIDPRAFRELVFAGETPSPPVTASPTNRRAALPPNPSGEHGDHSRWPGALRRLGTILD